MLNVTVWNEDSKQENHPHVLEVYPDGLNAAIADVFRRDEALSVRMAHLCEPEAGLPEDVLEDTDVLVWWGHCKHGQVPDAVVERVQNHVLRGMGLIVLHSGHHSKPFRLLMGTTCNLTWREDGDMEQVWVVAPDHPIVQGIDRYFNLPHEEAYGEPFDIPEPDKLVLIGRYEGGEVFRSGCCWRRGRGKIFYFQPGHETYPTYTYPTVQRLLVNAVRWAAPESRVPQLDCPNVKKPEPHWA